MPPYQGVCSMPSMAAVHLKRFPPWGRSDDLVAGLFLDSLEVFEKSALCVGCHL